MQCPPTNASRPSMTTILRWSRSFSTPMLRNVRSWKNLTTVQPAVAHQLALVACPSSSSPCASSSTRTCTPGPGALGQAHRPRAGRARPPSTGRSRSAPSCCAAPMRSISTSKNAPFSSTSTALPSTAVPSVRPGERGHQLVDRRRRTRSCRSGSRWRRIDQITRTRTVTRASSTQNQILIQTSAPPSTQRASEPPEIVFVRVAPPPGHVTNPRSASSCG